MLSKVLLVVVAAVSVTVASAVPAESSGHYDPAVRYGQTSTNGMDFYCLAGANSEWRPGAWLCVGGVVFLHIRGSRSSRMTPPRVPRWQRFRHLLQMDPGPSGQTTYRRGLAMRFRTETFTFGAWVWPARQ